MSRHVLPGCPKNLPCKYDVRSAQRRSATSFVRDGNRPKARAQNGHCFSTIRQLQQHKSKIHTMKDPRQGAAAIVFLIFYVFAFAFTLFCLFTRRAKRHIFSVFIFNLIRIGANIASLGWAIHLYDNFDWLIASLILGTEGECCWK